jgi:CheY-like chemotaxis protein
MNNRICEGNWVLVVDDDKAFQKYSVDALVANGYHVRVAGDGVEGIKMAQQIPAPGLILMDIMMPGIDGYTACSELKSKPLTSNIPIVMVSAHGFELNKKLAERCLSDGYLVKPLAMSSLLDTVNMFLRPSDLHEAANLPLIAGLNEEETAVFRNYVHKISQDGLHSLEEEEGNHLHDLLWKTAVVRDLFLGENSSA